MTGGDLVEALKDRGFRAVDSDLPGGWATDGERSVCITTTHGPRGLEHTVRVYDDPTSLVSVETPLLARTHDSSTALAIRRAFDQLEDGGDA